MLERAASSWDHPKWAFPHGRILIWLGKEFAVEGRSEGPTQRRLFGASGASKDCSNSLAELLYDIQNQRAVLCLDEACFAQNYVVQLSGFSMRSHIVAAQLEYVLAFNDADHRKLLETSCQRGLGLRRCRSCARVRPGHSDDGCTLAIPNSTSDFSIK